MSEKLYFFENKERINSKVQKTVGTSGGSFISKFSWT
jgi:hypothetical protein